MLQDFAINRIECHSFFDATAFDGFLRHAVDHAAGLVLRHRARAGMLEMLKAGARTVAQDEASCVVYGMPKEAVKRGGVEKTVALNAIYREIVQQLSY